MHIAIFISRRYGTFTYIYIREVMEWYKRHVIYNIISPTWKWNIGLIERFDNTDKPSRTGNTAQATWKNKSTVLIRRVNQNCAIVFFFLIFGVFINKEIKVIIYLMLSRYSLSQEMAYECMCTRKVEFPPLCEAHVDQYLWIFCH